MKKVFIFLLSPALIAVQLTAQPVFRISSGTNLFANPNTRIVLSNIGFENNGTTGFATSSRFIFTGNNPVANITGTGNILFGELEINKSAGLLQLNRFVNVFTGVQFTSGNIDLNGNQLIFTADPNGQLTAENNNSRILGNSGFARKLSTLNAPTNINPGNIGVAITSTANLGATTIERHHYNIGNLNVRRIFRLTPTTNTALNATLRFSYLDAELGAINENTLAIWKSPDGIGGWSNIGGTVDAAQNTISVNGVNDLSWFAIAPVGSPLPLVLTSFGGTCNNNEILLHWQTQQEINTATFEIENSSDAIQWNVLASVAAAGNSAAVKNYQHKLTATEKNYYRLKMIDADGKFTYSKVITVNCNNNKWNVKLYPNPATDRIELALNNIKKDRVQIIIHNAAGQLVWQQMAVITNGNAKVIIPVTALGGGVYYLLVDDETNKQTIPFSKQ